MANDRTITLAGDFKQSVNVTNSLTNGSSCAANDFSHAEGYRSQADGKYSFAGGYMAHAQHHRSFVWSGDGSAATSLRPSNGDGTFNIWTNSDSSSPMSKVFIDGKSLEENISNKFASIYDNTNLLTSGNYWSGSLNAFGSGDNHMFKFSDSGSLTCESNTNIEFNGQMAKFNGALVTKTVKFAREGETGVGGLSSVATTQYVKNAISSSLGGLLPNYVSRECEDVSVGSETNPVYVKKDGKVAALSSAVVFRSSVNAGSDTKPIFMENGAISESTANVGSDGKPVYMEGGTVKALTKSVGDDGRSLVYLNQGEATRSRETVGDIYRPVFLRNGSLTPMGELTNGTIKSLGGQNVPIYIDSKGKFTTCNPIPSGTGDSGGIKSVELQGLNLVENNFVTKITIPDGFPDKNGKLVLSGETSRPTIGNIYGLTELHGKFTSSLSSLHSAASLIRTDHDALSNSYNDYVNTIAPSRFSPSIYFSYWADDVLKNRCINNIGFENTGGSIHFSLTTQEKLSSIVKTSTDSNKVVGDISLGNDGVLTIDKYFPNITCKEGTGGDVVYSIDFDRNSGTLTYNKKTISSGGTSGFSSVDNNLTGSWSSYNGKEISGNSVVSIDVSVTNNGYTLISAGIDNFSVDSKSVTFCGLEILSNTSVRVHFQNIGDHKHNITSVKLRCVGIK